MTNQEAIVHIKDVICENNVIKPNIVVFEQEKEALYMAIKALENQKSIVEELEKIKEEIIENQYITCGLTCISCGYCKYFDCIEVKEVIECLELIEKHISELKGE